MKIAFASFLALSVLSASAPKTPSFLDYRFDEVRRSVTVTTPSRQIPAETGLIARSGDRVQTGWFSYALIASEQHRAKFEIFSSTEVQLAGGTPGVILSLERGHLHAIFDKITGSEPRIVQTPGALLAVRGTQYDVNVDNGGHTTLNVTDGVVEVRSGLREEPLFVRAGESCSYGLHEPPIAHPAPSRGPFDPNHRGREGAEGRGTEGAEGHGNEPEGSEHGHGPGPGMIPPAGTPSQPPSPAPPRSHP
jgi:FecR protein